MPLTARNDEIINSNAPESNADNQALADHINQMMVAIEALLRQQPQGLPELRLIRALQAPPWQLLGSIDFADPAQLYPAHFLVFHCLYRLRDDLARNAEVLEISPLLIRLGKQATVAGSGFPGQPDQLRLFYLDLAQLYLSASKIQQLLDNFWAGRHGAPIDDAELKQAAETLGFSDPPESFAAVQTAYRRKAMTTHPDRGGTTGSLQAVNAAFTLLRHHFRS